MGTSRDKIFKRKKLKLLENPAGTSVHACIVEKEIAYSKHYSWKIPLCFPTSLENTRKQYIVHRFFLEKKHMNIRTC